MNLTTAEWIPVLRLDGRRDEVGLLRAFTEGRDIADLSVRPHERIALLRLLICVAQAALDGPKDEDEWRDCLAKIPRRVTDYLAEWRPAFELFGDNQRFLQVANLESTKADDDEGNAVDKLDVALACGNNSTLFDNAGGSDRFFAPAELARMLVTFQSFAPGGLIGIANWNRKPTAATKSAVASVCIASSPLHAFVRKANLLETVHANLITRETLAEHGGRDAQWGEPVWQRMPTEPGDLPLTTRSYLGRLAPVARAVWLNDDGQTAIIAKALDYPAFDEVFAEASMTIVAKKDKRVALRAEPSRAIWRQLAAITTLRRTGDLGGPLALKNVLDSDCFDLWAGALVTHPMQIAKLVDTVESVFHRVPVAMTQETGHLIYGEGVAYAQWRAGCLNRAIANYRRRLKDEIERGEGRKRGLNLKARAALHYWTAAEHLVPELFRLVASPPPVERARYQFARTAWGKALFRAALDAYEFACPHETPRQLQAYVLGRAELVRPAPETEPTEETEEQTV
ncbi:MAG: type I-E CRISPR-associated protein Cse1/CasA [Verrucomicrobia bacterium]|nr:type I-E CRISPR-associated protein Cse1/CasA [Verrucomicrobiota bacterium]